ncbi:MAG: hypothetical protein F6J95_011865 [Leptolyngbya sp. SIO1E4]|nr:hypothetical protein [Leptolyngbya sp. SIO1E4]
MEALAILFVIGVFVWLLSPEKKSKPKSSGDKLMDGIIAAAVDIKGALNKDSGGGGSKKKAKGWEDSPCFVVLMTIFIGFLLTYLL